MNEALVKAYESARDRMHGVSFADFSKALEGAVIHPVYVDGACVGAVIVDRHEVHACIIPEARGRWFGKAQARILRGILDRFGVASTAATTAAGVEFVKRLGFRQFGPRWLKGA